MPRPPASSIAAAVAAIALAAAVSVGVGACRADAGADTSHGTNEVVGAISGRDLSVEGASFCPSGFGSPDDVTLILSTRDNDCDGRRAQIARPDATTLTLHLVQAAGPGTFRVKQGSRGAGQALARFTAVDDECGEELARDADEGTVTVTALDASSTGFIRGTFDVSFGGERLHGDFDTSVCTVDYFCGESNQCAR